MICELRFDGLTSIAVPREVKRCFISDPQPLLNHQNFTRIRMPNVPTSPIFALTRVRDVGSFSSRNSSKGSLLSETFLLLSTFGKEGLTSAELRERALRGQMFPRASFENRQRIWDNIHYRYFSPRIPWIPAQLAAAASSGVGSPEFTSLAYLYFALRDRLTFTLVTELLWTRWRKRSLNIAVNDGLDFLDQNREENPSVQKWSSSTRTKLMGSILAALRDFGVLKGTTAKQIHPPAIALETAFHLLCILIAEGNHGRAIVDAKDWRLFMWSPDDAAKALMEMSQRKWIRFERGGQTVILELIRTPEVLA